MAVQFLLILQSVPQTRHSSIATRDDSRAGPHDSEMGQPAEAGQSPETRLSAGTGQSPETGHSPEAGQSAEIRESAEMGQPAATGGINPVSTCDLSMLTKSQLFDESHLRQLADDISSDSDSDSDSDKSVCPSPSLVCKLTL
jgi:hypothetical protein